MYVSSEVRRREIPDTTPDPTQYAAAAHGASFMAVLAEVGNTNPENSDIPASPNVEGSEKAPATDISPSQGVPSEETKVNETKDDGASETVTKSDTETATEASSDPVETAQDIETPVPAVTAAEPDLAAPVTVTTPATVVEECSAEISTATIDGAVAKVTPAAMEPTGISPGEAVASSAKEGAAEVGMAKVTIEDIAASDTPPETAAVPFPKTLNAIVAEGALRQSTEETDKAESPSKENAKTQETADVPGTDLHQDLPSAQPLPHAAALEVGGVRLQPSTNVPRVPLANLPGELAQQIHMMQQEGATSMRLRVVPENLGDIQIEIHGSGDRLQVRLVSANPVVRDALENQMGDLKNALQKQGLALDNATVGGEAARQNASRQSERQTSAPTAYRTPRAAVEVAAPRSRSIAPAALGSSALNILA